MLTLEQARKVASDWHGGQSSALYSFASTGRLFKPLNDYLFEILDNRKDGDIAPELAELSAFLAEELKDKFIILFDCMDVRAMNKTNANRWVDQEIGLFSHAFRLIDADDNHMFYGRSTEESFTPKDHYGEAFGAVTIEYVNEYGEWEAL